MKTITIKKTIQTAFFCAVILFSTIITKNTIRNMKRVYYIEKMSNNSVTCFFDLIH
ncbi:MAG: hypothetical protein V4677_09425 [Bacteroidota bacterium]